jgi:hypothetical protein
LIESHCFQYFNTKSKIQNPKSKIKMSVFKKVRNWIDGDSSETVLEEAARDAQVKPRSIAEEFIVKLARSVEDVMQREMVPLPQGTTLIPTEYTIFLSDEDDKEWQGVKRRGLEQGLYHVLAERAKEISGKKKLETQSFGVTLRVDGTLAKGDVRVQHSWDDNAQEKTSILSGGKPKSVPPTPIQPKIANPVAPIPYVPPQPVVPTPLSNEPPPTMMQGNIPNYNVSPPSYTPPQSSYTPPQSYTPPVSGEGEEMTHVKKRVTELFKLEIWRGGVRQNLVPVFQNEISIGRGSKSKPVDISLPGDPEISRRHVTIVLDQSGTFWLINEGRNPALVSNREIPMGQRAKVNPGETIAICTYLLRVQPR